MSHRPNESFVSKQQGKQYGTICDKNVEQRIQMKFCLKIGRSASETLALLTVAYGEYAMKKSTVFEWHVSLAVQDHARVFLRSQGDCSLWIHFTWTNGESTVLFGSGDKVTEISSEEWTRTLSWQVDSPSWQWSSAWCARSSRVPGQEIHYKNGHSILFTWFSSLRFWALSEINKCPEGTKICRHSWHLTQCDNVTERSSGRRFWRLFPAVTSASHEVHSFTRWAFGKWQKSLVHMQADLLTQGHSWN
jgi:hypothetical protein